MCVCAGKEYSKADSRYASRDSFIIAMEAITAFLWGPLCPLLVHGIFAAKPWRYTLMVVVSVGQLYGDVLYYGTCYLEGACARAAAGLDAFGGVGGGGGGGGGGGSGVMHRCWMLLPGRVAGSGLGAGLVDVHLVLPYPLPHALQASSTPAPSRSTSGSTL